MYKKKRDLVENVHISLFLEASNQKWLKISPTDEWTDTLWNIHDQRICSNAEKLS